MSLPVDTRWREGKLPEALHKARAHPQWSSLNPQARLNQPERQEQIDLLLQRLAET
jgi:ribosome assembly protein YihI (activator of Der GTPase)